VYVVDTSSLIRLGRDYPPDVFSSLWDLIEQLIVNGLLVAPREVFREPAKGDDELLKWAKANGKLFVEIDEKQTNILKQILDRFPSINDTIKLGPHADPWLVALGVVCQANDAKLECCVVTEEREKGPGSTSVPNVCKEFGLRAVNLLEFFRLEKVKF